MQTFPIQTRLVVFFLTSVCLCTTKSKPSNVVRILKMHFVCQNTISCNVFCKKRLNKKKNKLKPRPRSILFYSCILNANTLKNKTVVVCDEFSIWWFVFHWLTNSDSLKKPENVLQPGVMDPSNGTSELSAYYEDLRRPDDKQLNQTTYEKLTPNQWLMMRQKFGIKN